MRGLPKLAVVDAFQLTATWKRSFFRRSSFLDAAALVNDAVGGGPSEAWVQHVLSLRWVKRNRRTMQQLRLAAACVEVPRWFKRFKMDLWGLYVLERSLCIRTVVHEDADVRTLSRRQRHRLRGQFAVHVRRPSAAMRAATMLDAMEVAALKGCTVVWMDNYNRPRYSRNPHERRDDAINGTAYAVLPTVVGLVLKRRRF